MSKPAVPFSEEIAIRICERLADGEALKNICTGEGMPARSTVYDWLATNAAFLTMYKAAREEHADAEFDRMDEMVNEAPPKDDRGRTDMGWVQNQRLKIDTKKWQLARMHPKKYAERFELTGAAGEPLVPESEELSEEQLIDGVRRLAFLLAKADHLIDKRRPAPLQLVYEAK